MKTTSNNLGISISLTLSKKQLLWCTQQIIEQGLEPNEENLSTFIGEVLNREMGTQRTGNNYVYELCYPVSMGGLTFYVGKGSGERYKNHAREARNGTKSAKCDVIRSIWERDEQVVVKMTHEHLSDLEAVKREKDRIYEIGYENLVNVPPRTKDRSYKGSTLLL